MHRFSVVADMDPVLKAIADPWLIYYRIESFSVLRCPMAGRDYSGRGIEPRPRVRSCTNYALYWDQQFREVAVAKIGVCFPRSEEHTYLAQLGVGSVPGAYNNRPKSAKVCDQGIRLRL